MADRSHIGSDVLIAIGTGIAGVVLLTLLTTTQIAISWPAGTLHIPGIRVVEGALIFWSSWVLLAPGIAILGRYCRLESGHLLRRSPVWIAAATLACIVNAVFMTALSRLLGVPLMIAEQAGPHSFFSGVWNVFAQTYTATVLVFAIAVLLYHALIYYSAYRDRGRREAALEAELARFRFHVLQRQLQPHFLFNALHTVSALMAEDVASARRVLAELGDLLRMVLDRMDEHEIPLEQEIEFLRRYIDIQTVRFGDRLTVEWAIDDAARSALVPSMILQPCVENAIQHGIEPLERGGRLKIAARLVAQSLHIDIADNGRGAAPDQEGQVAGHGLVSVRERLRAQYGERYTFDAGNATGGGYRARIVLPVDR
jgi:two-component system, LytTR family, sensor kinase